MDHDLCEPLRTWFADEVSAAVFRSLLAVEILELKVAGIPPQLLTAVRDPLYGLYSLCIDPDTEGSF